MRRPHTQILSYSIGSTELISNAFTHTSGIQVSKWAKRLSMTAENGYRQSNLDKSTAQILVTHKVEPNLVEHLHFDQ